MSGRAAFAPAYWLNPPESSINEGTEDELILPDAFMTGRPRTRTPPNTTGNVIDLTDGSIVSPPTREVIDLDSIPDAPALPVQPLRLPTPTDESMRARARRMQRGVINNPYDEMALQRARDHSSHSIFFGEEHAGRREWLLQQARRRTADRQAAHDQAEGDHLVAAETNRPRVLARLHGPEDHQFINMLGPATSRYGAFLRTPLGGGPMALEAVRPEHFTPGATVAVYRTDRHNIQFEQPSLDYEIHNELMMNMPYFLGRSTPAAMPQPPTPKYVAPDPVKDPFTRTFTDSDVLICPGCRTELGGAGDETKRRIFVSKCSHVYCGECGNNLKSVPGRNKGIMCQAAGCDKKITKARIFEAYV